MHNYPVNSRGPRRTIVALVVALAVSQAYAERYSAGAQGAHGVSGTTPGASGTDGGAGGVALAIAGLSDTSAYATGGTGGWGGDGATGAAGQGRGGNGGNGGAAEARHIIQSGGAQVTAIATARGGDGGLGGSYFNNPGPWSGIGGAGGDALAVVDAAARDLVTGRASAQGGGWGRYSPVNGSGGNAAVALRGSGRTVVLKGTATGGAGGAEWRAGTAGMTSGSASGTIEGTAGDGGLTGELTLVGGSGATAATNGAGVRAASGADVVARNPFAVTTTGPLALTLTGTGGAAGAVGTGLAGRAGRSDLDVTVDGGRASSVTTTVTARGGDGANASAASGTASAGATGKAVLQASGSGPVTATAEGIGGEGGRHVGGTSGDGGLGVAQAVARTSGAGPTEATARATGGDGGTIGYREDQERSGIGGNGGSAQGSAYASNSANGLVEARLYLKGGGGGSVQGAGRDGNGGAAIAVDNVGGATGGTLRLVQSAQGGGGEKGGLAVSRLKLTNNDSSDLSVSLVAQGGGGTQAGSAQAELELKSTRQGAQVSTRIDATSGQGGAASDGVTARSTISALGNVYNVVYASNLSGGGGQAPELSAYGRSESTVGVYTSVTAQSYADEGTFARARGESISTGGTSTVEVSARAAQVDVSGYSAAHGKAQSNALVEGAGAQLSILRATSVSTQGPLTVETSANRVSANDVNRYLKLSAATNITGVKPRDAGLELMSAASFRPADGTPLDATPAVAAAFETIDLVGEGVMHGVNFDPMTADEHQRTTASFRFDTMADGGLTLGLIGFNGSGQFLRQLELSVFSHGTELYSHTFGSMAEADAFFRDSALSLGTLTAGSQDIMIATDFLFDGEGTAGFRYVLGVEALAAVPEPGTWMMVLLGLTLVVVRVRRQPRG